MCNVDRQNAIDGFVLYDHEIVNQHIQTITSVNTLAIVNDWYDKLRQNFSPTLAKFVGMTLLICRFEQTRAKCFVNLDSSVNDVSCNGFNFFCYLRFLLRWIKNLNRNAKFAKGAKFLNLFLCVLRALGGSFSLLGLNPR